MKRFFFLFLLCSSFIVNAQQSCNIISHYDQFLTIRKFQVNGKNHLMKQLAKVDKDHCFKDFINENIIALNYIFTQFCSKTNDHNLVEIEDSVELHNTFIENMKYDTLFNNILGNYAAKALSNSIPKDTLSIDDLMSEAVKHFHIIRVNDEGNYVGKVCAGRNTLLQNSDTRNIHIEAFTFAAILKNYQAEDFSMLDEFTKAMKQLYTVDLGNDKKDKLLRAQGGMYLLMRNNENLKKALQKEYKTSKNHLPFVLI